MLEIRSISHEHGQSLMDLLLTASECDRRFFCPFTFALTEIEDRLIRVQHDKYYGIFLEAHRLAGFYMLRGLDEGYASPMYGVFIHPDYRRLGLGKLTLSHAVCYSRFSGRPSLRLGVHPENGVAIRAYQNFGFKTLHTHDDRIDMELLLQ